MFPWASEVLARQKMLKQKSNISVWDIEKIFDWKVYVCDFGHRHFLNQKCKCLKEYRTLWIIFKEKLKELWYEINYNSDITVEMQKKYKFLILNKK